MVDESTAGRVSVVIPSKDEGAWVKSTVEAVLQVSGPLLLEVIVVDDGSSDGSCDRLEELTREVPVRVTRTAGAGVSGAKNLGAAEASGLVLVFLDAHSWPEWGWLQEICDVLDMGHAGAAPLVALFDKDEKVFHPGMVGRWFVAGRPVYEVGDWMPPKGEVIPLGLGGCQAFWRDTFQSIGGFCAEELSPIGGEDTEICLRMWSRGGTIGAAPAAKVNTLFREWDERPNKDALVDVTWANLVKAQVLHWGAGRLTTMWARLHEEWLDHPDQFAKVWEACHRPSVMELRDRYRAGAVLTERISETPRAQQHPGIPDPYRPSRRDSRDE